MEKEKVVGILGNITEEEMELAISTIQQNRDNKARIARIKELEKTLHSCIQEIHSLNGSVHIVGGVYVPISTKVNSSCQTALFVRT